MDCSMPGFAVLHYLPEFTQTHVHWVGDAIQPSHSLSWMWTLYHGIQDQQFSWQILLLSPLDTIVQSLYFYVCKTHKIHAYIDVFKLFLLFSLCLLCLAHKWTKLISFSSVFSFQSHLLWALNIKTIIPIQVSVNIISLHFISIIWKHLEIFLNACCLLLFLSFTPCNIYAKKEGSCMPVKG